jgi:hypothetical protein
VLMASLTWKWMTEMVGPMVVWTGGTTFKEKSGANEAGEEGGGRQRYLQVPDIVADAQLCGCSTCEGVPGSQRERRGDHQRTDRRTFQQSIRGRPVDWCRIKTPKGQGREGGGRVGRERGAALTLLRVMLFQEFGHVFTFKKRA